METFSVFEEDIRSEVKWNDELGVKCRCWEVNHWRTDFVFKQLGGWAYNSEVWAWGQREEQGELVSLDISSCSSCCWARAVFSQCTIVVWESLNPKPCNQGWSLFWKAKVIKLAGIEPESVFFFFLYCCMNRYMAYIMDTNEEERAKVDSANPIGREG
jgi:hypothetical protein